jgi:hypothetical protein
MRTSVSSVISPRWIAWNARYSVIILVSDAGWSGVSAFSEWKIWPVRASMTKAA